MWFQHGLVGNTFTLHHHFCFPPNRIFMVYTGSTENIFLKLLNCPFLWLKINLNIRNAIYVTCVYNLLYETYRREHYVLVSTKKSRLWLMVLIFFISVTVWIISDTEVCFMICVKMNCLWRFLQRLLTLTQSYIFKWGCFDHKKRGKISIYTINTNNSQLHIWPFQSGIKIPSVYTYNW